LWQSYDGVDEGLNVTLLRAEAEPHCSHHDRQTHVHRNADAVRYDVSVTLDEVAVDQCQRNHELIRRLRLLSTNMRVSAAQRLCTDLASNRCSRRRPAPRILNACQLTVGLSSVVREVGVHQVDDEFSRVGEHWYLVAQRVEVGLNVRDCSIVHSLTARQEEQAVEQGEGQG